MLYRCTISDTVILNYFSEKNILKFGNKSRQGFNKIIQCTHIVHLFCTYCLKYFTNDYYYVF